MNPQSRVLDRLRAATAAAHSELDSRLNVIDRLSTLNGRRAMVPRYYRMHRSAEQAAWSWLESIQELDLPARGRLPLLTADLEALGVASPAEGGEAMAFGSHAEALGLLYVLEGSTLGGRMIRKAIGARESDLTGLSFLDPYGSSTGVRWRDFLKVMEREAAHDPEAAVRGAIRGFEHAGTCLFDGVGAS